MQRRPSGVTFSAVVLGVISLFLFLAGVFDITVAVLFARSPGFPPTPRGQPAPPPHLMLVAFGFMALLTLACSAWGAGTMRGLLRMRPWARISIMVIGGCLTAFSLLEVCGCIVVQVSMKNLVLPPDTGSANLVATNPDALQSVFFFIEAIFAGIAAIGIWWLVYFALRRIRDAFEAVPLQPKLSSTVQLDPATPITDFRVAQPLETAPTPTELPAARIAPAARARPISMTIVAVLMFLGSLSMLLCCMMPYHLFFFGVEVSGPSQYVVLVSLATLYALAGFGLLQKMHIGWLLAVGVHILGLLNLFTFLSPHVRASYSAYMKSVSQLMMPAMPNSSQISMQVLQQNMVERMLIPGLLLGVVYILVIMVLLWRARWWYKTVSAE